jgi:hypothetical protein
LVNVTHGPNRAGEAHLPEINGILGRGPAGEGREEGCDGGKIGRRIAELQSARDIEIDVMTCEPHAAAGFEHGNQHS